MNSPTSCFLAWYLVQGHLAQRRNGSFGVLTICWVSAQDRARRKPFCKGTPAGFFCLFFYTNHLACSLLCSRTLKSIRARHKLLACSISSGALQGYDRRDGRQTKAETFPRAPFGAFRNFGSSPTTSPPRPGRAPTAEDNL